MRSLIVFVVAVLVFGVERCSSVVPLENNCSCLPSSFTVTSIHERSRYRTAYDFSEKRMMELLNSSSFTFKRFFLPEMNDHKALYFFEFLEQTFCDWREQPFPMIPRCFPDSTDTAVDATDNNLQRRSYWSNSTDNSIPRRVTLEVKVTDEACEVTALQTQKYGSRNQRDDYRFEEYSSGFDEDTFSLPTCAV